MTRTTPGTGAAVASAGAVVLPLALPQFIGSYAASTMNVAIGTIAADLDTPVSGIQTTVDLDLEGELRIVLMTTIAPRTPTFSTSAPRDGPDEAGGHEDLQAEQDDAAEGLPEDAVGLGPSPDRPERPDREAGRDEQPGQQDPQRRSP
jgi:hypothetical protein